MAHVRTSETTLRTLFDSTDIGFCLLHVIVGPDGEASDCLVLDVNPAFRRLTGLENAIGERSTRLARGGQPPRLELYGRVVRTGTPERFELRSDISRRDFDVFVVRLGSVDDRCLAVMFADITERRRAEALVRAREARQAFLLQLSDRLRPLADAAAIQFEAARAIGEYLGAHRVGYAEAQSDRDSVVVARNYVNGMKPVEGRYRYDDFGPDAFAFLREGRSVVRPDVANDSALSEAKKAAYAELQIGAAISVPLLKEGRLLAVLFVQHSSARDWSTDDVALVEEVAARTWDAVERAKVESTLRHSETRYRALSDLSPEAIFVSVDDEVLYANPAAADLVGAPDATSLIGHSALNLVEPTSRGRVRARIRQVLEEQRTQPRIALRFQRLDGSLISVEVASGPTVWEGRPAAQVVARDVTERERSEAALREAHEALERRVRERTSELAATNASLQAEVGERRAAEDQIKALFRRLVTIQEEERRRIARNLHDQLGQQLTALRMSLEILRTKADGHVELAARIARTQELAHELDQGIDFLTWELRPALLDHLGISAALANLVQNWSDRFAVAASFDGSETEGLRLPAEMESNLYRLAQEALHNVYKHAGASHVRISLRSDATAVTLAIEDNGRGFDPAQGVSRESNAGLGLLNMRERAMMVGGQLQIQSLPNRGTTIVVRAPIVGPIDLDTRRA